MVVLKLKKMKPKTELDECEGYVLYMWLKEIYERLGIESLYMDKN